MFNLGRSLPSLVVPATRTFIAGRIPKVPTPKYPQHPYRLYLMFPEPTVDDTMVGCYPKTKEDRILAAKRYNLIPEDYEPFDEDDGWGDYPKLKAVGNYNRDLYDDYDDPFDQRFYGEPYHIHADLYYWERVDPLMHEKLHTPYWQQILFLFAFCGGIVLLERIIVLGNLNINHPYKISKYSQDHYTFPSSPNDPKIGHDHH